MELISVCSLKERLTAFNFLLGAEPSLNKMLFFKDFSAFTGNSYTGVLP